MYSAVSHKETVLTTTRMRDNVTLLSRANSDLVFENFAASAKPLGSPSRLVHVSSKISLVLLQVILLQLSVNCGSPGLIHLHMEFSEDL